MTPVVGWGASYGMMWDTRVDGDQLLDAAGPYQFNHWWLFNIYNRSGNSLPAPKISATLDGSLSGIDAGMSPPDPNITLTKTGTNAEWSMNQLAPGGQPGGGMQGTLWTTTATQPITDSYTLGFDAMRQLSNGRVVAGGASGEPRTFTMTVIAHDTTLSDIGTSIDLSGGASNPNPGPVSTSNVTCDGPGFLQMNPNGQVFWKIGEGGYSALHYETAYTLNCQLNLTNSASSPALFTPLVISSGRRLAAPMIGVGSVSYASLAAPTDPPDQLGGVVTFSTGAPDVLGSVEVIFTRTAILSAANKYDDTTPPVTTATVTPTPVPTPFGGWNNSAVTVTLHATDPGGSGVSQIMYSVGPGPFVTVRGDTATVTFDSAVMTTVNYHAHDNAGNIEMGQSLPIRIDTTPPTANAMAWGGNDVNGQRWWNAGPGSVMVNISAPDECAPNVPCSGTKRIWYALNGASPMSVDVSSNSPATSVAVSAEGATTVTYYAEDNVGNIGTTNTFVVNIDKTKPVTTATVSPTPTGGWTKGPVTVTFHATDAGGSGVSQIMYGVGPEWFTVPGDTATVTLDSAIMATVTYHAHDNAGNKGDDKSVLVQIDNAAPTVTVMTPPARFVDSLGNNWWIANPLMVGLNANDGCAPNVPCSGTKQIWYSMSGAQPMPLTSAPTGFINLQVSSEGTTAVTYYAEDNAGNVSTPKTFVVNIDRTAPVTTATVSPTPSLSPNGSWNNSAVTVTFHATDPGGSGVSQIMYSVGPDWYTVPGDSATVTFDSAMAARVNYHAHDNVGYKGDDKWVQIRIDTAPPSAYAGANPTTQLTDGQGRKWWDVNAVTVTINATDNCVPTNPCSLARRIWYSATGAQAVPLTSADGLTVSGAITAEGTTTVTYYAEDNAGNLSTPKTFVVNIDRTAPVLALPANITLNATGLTGATVTFAATASDGGSGAGAVTCVPASGSLFPFGTTTVSCSAADAIGHAASGAFSVTVINQPPVCSAATPSVASLWPPNHQWVPISILNVTDPEGGPVTIVVKSIFQDEPTNSRGDGNTAIDGKGVGTSIAYVRAERSGDGDDDEHDRGNGRVYHIRFSASDGQSTCNGEVIVTVPHDRRGVAVDEGALYDSTVESLPAGHSHNDGCKDDDHERGRSEHADGDKCDHELGRNGHKKGDGCDHERRGNG